MAFKQQDVARDIPLAPRDKRTNWSDAMSFKLIEIVAELDCLAILDGKCQRNKDVFEKVCNALNDTLECKKGRGSVYKPASPS